MRDHRTVAELVADSDALARDLLLDVSADRAPGMARAWYEVAHAAARLWAVLPSEAPNSRADPDIMDRLNALAVGIGRSGSVGGWPGGGPADEHLLEISDNLTHAAVLVRENFRNGQVAAPEGQHDIAALRGQVVHTLYVATHGTGLAISAYVSQLDQQSQVDVRHRRRMVNRPDLAEATAARDLGTRIGVFEQVAGGWVATHPLAERDHGTVPPETRLEIALAGWDIQAHRTLAWNADTPDLVRVGRVQALIAAATNVVAQAAAHLGLADPVLVHRLAPMLQQTEVAWIRTARRWGELVSPASRTDPALIEAAGHVRAAVAATACTRAGWATPGQLARHVDLSQTVATLQLGTASAVDLSYLTREVAATRQLTAPARAVGMRVQSEAEMALDRGDTRYEGATWATLRELRTNQLVPIPEPVRRGLVNLTEEVIVASGQAAAAAAALHPSTPGQIANPREASRPGRPSSAFLRPGLEGPRP